MPTKALLKVALPIFNFLTHRSLTLLLHTGMFLQSIKHESVMISSTTHFLEDFKGITCETKKGMRETFTLI